jgi:hypothetical protein
LNVSDFYGEIVWGISFEFILDIFFFRKISFSKFICQRKEFFELNCRISHYCIYYTINLHNNKRIFSKLQPSKLHKSSNMNLCIMKLKLQFK